MPKTDSSFNPDDYTPVALRIGLFYQTYPRGRIITRLISYENGRAIVMAEVYRSSTDPQPSATGLASERETDGEINAVACLENTETSAIGRALANLGITGAVRRPSREEMEKAGRARRALSLDTITLQSSQSGLRVVSEPSPLDSERQEHANAVARVLRLIQRATLVGLRQRRAESFHARVSTGAINRRKLEQIEARLRGWVERHGRRSFGIVT